jgi:hypothetical protein
LYEDNAPGAGGEPAGNVTKRNRRPIEAGLKSPILEHTMIHSLPLALLVAIFLFGWPQRARAEGDWEITPQSEAALERGLQWLARNQGPQGNWESNDLGLVALGALAFLAAGHTPGHGKYGQNIDRALDYVLKNAQPNGLLNISNSQRDMYNHGLAAFVLGQAHGMSSDPRIGPALEKALKLIVRTQCKDGGWDYHARHQERGHDLSLAVMQAKALRSAVDSGFEIPPETIDLAIKSVQGYYRTRRETRGLSEDELKQQPGQFTYNGGGATLAMAAAGVVCLQEFGRYDDWRIPRNMEVLSEAVKKVGKRPGSGEVPFDAYTLYYVGQALYQVGGEDWRQCYPYLRDAVTANQIRSPADPARDGQWRDTKHVGGRPGELYGTSVACFILAMPNRYLPILQEGKIESLRRQFEARP